MINRKIKRIISFLVFPFQNSRWVKFYNEYLPFSEDDGQMLFFSMYGARCAVYAMDDKFLNKSLLNDLKKRYKEFTYLNHFMNSAHNSDISIANFQQMQFLIMLKPRLFVEFDSMRYYRIYYDYRYEETELQEVLTIFRKNQKIEWPKSLQHIKLN